MSPTSFSTRFSRVDDAGDARRTRRRPRRCAPRPSCSSAQRAAAAVWSPGRRPITLRTRSRTGPPIRCARVEQVPDVHEADHLVRRSVHDRVPGVRVLPRLTNRVAAPGDRRQEVDLRPGDMASRTCRSPAANTSRTMCRSWSGSPSCAHHQFAELLDADLVAKSRRVGSRAAAASRSLTWTAPRSPAGTGSPAGPTSDRAASRRPRLAAWHTGAGVSSLTTSAMKVTSSVDHDDAEALRGVARPFPTTPTAGEWSGQGGGAEGGGEESGDDRPDLHRRQVSRRLAGEFDDPSSARSRVRRSPQLTRPQRDQGQLGRGEQPADDQQHQHDHEVQPDSDPRQPL